ncbi:hypothetical protein F511_31046 [Dorcoceras hygrometricum]|uniref:Pectinesterase inhibitor domain-containing protein n=1 Tax=Dorcoceras hygrometricum TaxID=472368 RepID=A0A2Z7B307_9LAMI|nr:hypothetical protein F511_31046 [Dorcoceras hygrometricum]
MSGWKINIVALSILSCFIFGEINADDVSQQWCQITDYNELCMNTIRADPRNFLKTSPEGLCRIIVDRAILVSSANMAKISELLRRSTGSSHQALSVCNEEYGVALNYLRRVDLSVINYRRYLDVAVEIAFSTQNAADCEDQFKQVVPPVPSPITNENRQLEDIIDTVCLIFAFARWDKIQVKLKNWRQTLSSIQAQIQDDAGETEWLRSVIDLACEVTDLLDEMALSPGSEDLKETTRKILAYECLPSIGSKYGTQQEEDNILPPMHQGKSTTKERHDQLIYPLVDPLASRIAAWMLQRKTDRELYEEKTPAQTHEHIHKEQSSPLYKGKGMKTSAENTEARTCADTGFYIEEDYRTTDLHG